MAGEAGSANLGRRPVMVVVAHDGFCIRNWRREYIQNGEISRVPTFLSARTKYQAFGRTLVVLTHHWRRYFT
jgi:hypothetical protein